MTTTKAIIISNKPTYHSKLVEQKQPTLQSGEVLIRTRYSSVNYKDALAITGKGRILKNFPLIPGIDVSGVIEKSTSPEFEKGQLVLINGCGLGEVYNGGYSGFVAAPADWVVPLPEGLSLKEAMIIGTAGFTAALCLKRMIQMDQTPEKGPIAITGASGGVGSIAIQLFSRAGFEVIAISNKKGFHPQLKKWGATKTMAPSELNFGQRPLEPTRFGGAVDNVGGELLAGLCRHVGLWGNIACVGLASSHELRTTVMPLILRGVSLLGVSSNNCPTILRKKIWEHLGSDWKPSHLMETLDCEVPLEQVVSVSEKMLQRKTKGRIIVSLDQ